MVSRRRALHLLGTGLVVGSGCLGEPGATPTPSEPPSETSPVETSTETPSGTPTEDRVTQSPAPGVRWVFQADGPVGTRVLFRDGTVFLGTKAGRVWALDAADGSVRWRYDTPEAVYTTTGHALGLHRERLVAISGEDVGTGGHRYRLHALDPGTGDVDWTTDGFPGRWNGLFGVAAGALVLGSSDDVVGDHRDPMALVEFDGATRWSAETGGLRGVATAGTTVAIGVYDAVSGRAAADGSERWRRETPIQYRGLVADDATIYLARDDREAPGIDALDPATGEPRWTVREWFVSTLRRVGRSGVVAGGEHVVRFAADGSEQWRYDPGGYVAGVPLLDGTLFTTPDKTVAAVDAETGAERWRTPAGGDVVPVVGADGVVVSERGREAQYVAHDAATGEQRWTLGVEGSSLPEPAVGDGAFFVGDASGRVFAREL